MLENTVVLVALAAVVVVLYIYRVKVFNLVRNQVPAIKGSAFARVAEHEGKLIALKVTTEVKKKAAEEAHKALDEIDKLLG